MTWLSEGSAWTIETLPGPKIVGLADTVGEIATRCECTCCSCTCAVHTAHVCDETAVWVVRIAHMASLGRADCLVVAMCWPCFTAALEWAKKVISGVSQCPVCGIRLCSVSDVITAAVML